MTPARSGKATIVALILALYLAVLYGPVLLLPLFSVNDNIYTVFQRGGRLDSALKVDLCVHLLQISRQQVHKIQIDAR